MAGGGTGNRQGEIQGSAVNCVSAKGNSAVKGAQHGEAVDSVNRDI